jgi:hypothetical protein
VAAALAAVLVRAVAAVALGAWRAPEAFETEPIVRNLLGGRGYTYEYLGTTYHSFHSILPYDLLTALVYALTRGSQAAMLGVQWLVAGLSCVVVWRLGARLAHPAVGVIAAWLLALHPGLVVYDATKLQQISFDVLTIALAILSFARWAERPSTARAVASGLVSGLLLYERGTMGLFFLVAVVWVKRVAKLSWGRWLRHAAGFALAAALVVAPWMIRNALIHRRFVPMMTTTWLALWKGNNEAATGTEYAADGRPVMSHRSIELRRALEGATETQQMDVFRDAALTFIREHPARVAALYGQKLWFFWWRSPHTGLGYASAWATIYSAWYLIVVLCGVVGVMSLRRQGEATWAMARLILWLGALFSAGQCLFYVAGRHRWMIEPILALLSAAGLWRLWQTMRLRRGAPAGACP